jgi:hypothetical protein
MLIDEDYENSNLMSCDDIEDVAAAELYTTFENSLSDMSGEEI